MLKYLRESSKWEIQCYYITHDLDFFMEIESQNGKDHLE